jgi:hypothetical protein
MRNDNKNKPQCDASGLIFGRSMPPSETKIQIAVQMVRAPPAPFGQSRLRIFAFFFVPSGFFSVSPVIHVHDQLLAQQNSKFKVRRG